MKRLMLLLLTICFGLVSRVLCAQHVPSVQESEGGATTKRMTAALAGKVIWDGQDLSHTSVSVYRDEKLTVLYANAIPELGDGRFTLRVEPDRYYLVAYVDVDRSGSFDPGDGLGIFGVTDWNDRGQTYQVVEVREGQKVSGLNIPITARAVLVDGELTTVPVTQYEPSQIQQFQTELRKATSGCSGTLTLGASMKKPQATARLVPGQKALILAYTDLSWKYRAGIARVADSGEWMLNLPPGKYYLMAIVDNNNTNKLDSGDDFGFYGIDNIRRRGAFPQPVLIASNKFTEELEITITATYQTRRRTQKEELVTVTGTVPLAQDATARIEAYNEPTFVTPVASTETDARGTFRLALPPGEYYLIANLDADKDGRYSEGDGLGAYGTVDITTQPPTPFVLKEGGFPQGHTIDILLSARYDADGHLHAVQPGIETHIQQGGITGQITWDGHALGQGILTLAYTPDFSSPIAIPISLSADGRYKVDVLPGRYYLMAVMDANGDGTTGISDGVGIYGTRRPARGEPTAVSVFPGRTTPHIDIEMFASYIDEKGNMAEIEDGGRWEIRRRYGEPEDVFRLTRNGQATEEWKYWTKGIGFKWRAVGAGWEFLDEESFTLKKSLLTERVEGGTEGKKGETSSNLPTFQSSNPLFIYFAYDGVIWRITPDEGVIPLGAGRKPTVANDGTLLYQDNDGNVIIQDSAAPRGRVLLDRRHMAEDAAISPDAKYLAYARTEFGNRRRLVMRHIRTDAEFVVPSTAQNAFTPAWNRDGKLLAYVTAGTIENPDADMTQNIYAFDQVTNSVEPIVVSPANDGAPTWSPANPNQLAFVRTEGDVGSGLQARLGTKQIWLVTYSNTGEPTEQQLTQNGGSHPVWIPPEGRWILYENNGQLWLVDTQNPRTSETPLVHGGRVVFGHEPAVINP